MDASKARLLLGWEPRLRLEEALAWTVDWYRRLTVGERALTLTDRQIACYHEHAT